MSRIWFCKAEKHAHMICDMRSGQNKGGCGDNAGYKVARHQYKNERTVIYKEWVINLHVILNERTPFSSFKCTVKDFFYRKKRKLSFLSHPSFPPFLFVSIARPFYTLHCIVFFRSRPVSPIHTRCTSYHSSIPYSKELIK
ncbi:hypothetical protein EYC84_003622 [Monilinia fructicola]|uniref:Uncharacterized protein n=1 Tax=Monilinia fructicola TaxID=38448 RepID=A0A5M9K2G2_MONFR|nr:hypothetical protein EYC84_003622 [Monilinia fructicola]